MATLGIKFIIGFHILNIIVWTVGQGGAWFSYDTVAEWGLQDPRDTIDPFVVVINRAIGLADAIIGVPIFLIALVGVWKMKFYGLACSMMAFGLSFYWPVVAWVKQSFYLQADVKCQPFDIPTHCMLALAFLFPVWGSWYLIKKRALFDEKVLHSD